MTNKKRILGLLMTGMLLVPAICLRAQEGLNKEVQVVKPYTPIISDAFKVRFMPDLNDTIQVPTRFDYYITPVTGPVSFRVRNLESVILRPEPRQKLQHSYVRLGLGNYWTPYGELDINTTESQKSSLGINMKHISSQGRIKMADDRLVYSGYADNLVKLYGAQYFRSSTLTGDVHFKEDHHTLYGYSTDTLSDGTLVTPYHLRVKSNDSLPERRFIVLGTNVSLKADERSRKGFLYQLDATYNFLVDDLNEMEHGANVDFNFSQEFKSVSFGAEIGGDYYYRIRSIDSLGFGLANLDPWIGFKWKYLNLVAGPKIAMDRNASQFYFYPKLLVEINITNMVVPYLGLNGYYEDHSLLKISRANPYIVNDLDVTATNHRFIAFGGLRGRFRPKIAFNLYLNWEDVDNWHFFVPDVSIPKRNQFDIVYDNGSLLQAGGELSLRQSKNLSFILKGNYYNYQLDNLAAAWHKPIWDGTFTTTYIWNEKLFLQADLYLFGKQYAPSVDLVKYGPTMELDPMIDLNFSAEYRFNKALSVFARVNNILSDNYYVWQNYPVQGINFLGGLSWSF